MDVDFLQTIFSFGSIHRIFNFFLSFNNLLTNIWRKKIIPVQIDNKIYEMHCHYYISLKSLFNIHSRIFFRIFFRRFSHPDPIFFTRNRIRSKDRIRIRNSMLQGQACTRCPAYSACSGRSSLHTKFNYYYLLYLFLCYNKMGCLRSRLYIPNLITIIYYIYFWIIIKWLAQGSRFYIPNLVIIIYYIYFWLII